MNNFFKEDGGITGAWEEDEREIRERLTYIEIENARHDELTKAIIQRLDYNNGKIDKIDSRVEALVASYHGRPTWTVSIIITILIALLSATVAALCV